MQDVKSGYLKRPRGARITAGDESGTLGIRLRFTLYGRQDLITEAQRGTGSRRELRPGKADARKGGQFFLLSTFPHLLGLEAIVIGSFDSLGPGQQVSPKIMDGIITFGTGVA